MFTNIRPCRVPRRKRTRTREQTPVHDRDDEGEGNDRGEEDRVRQLERTVPFVEGGTARKGVDEGVEGCKEEVEC